MNYMLDQIRTNMKISTVLIFTLILGHLDLTNAFTEKPWWNEVTKTDPCIRYGKLHGTVHLEAQSDESYVIGYAGRNGYTMKNIKYFFEGVAFLQGTYTSPSY